MQHKNVVPQVGASFAILSTGAHDGETICAESINIPMDVSAPRLSATPYDGASSVVTSALFEMSAAWC